MQFTTLHLPPAAGHAALLYTASAARSVFAFCAVHNRITVRTGACRWQGGGREL